MNYQRSPYNKVLIIKDRRFKIYWSAAAERELKQRASPMLVEMRLKFVCMVRIQVHFHENIEHHNSINITDKLRVVYRPVTGQRCSLSEPSERHASGELTSGPMANQFPKQLGIYFMRGTWRGEYL